MAVTHITMDLHDTVKVTFDSTDWLGVESTTVASYTLAATGGIAIATNSRALGVVTAMVTATASGTLTCKFTFADGQIRERTMPITVND